MTPPRAPRPAKPIIRRVLVAALRVYIAIAVFVYFFQPRLLYFPRPYDSTTIANAARVHPVVNLDFTTSQGRQQAYYLPPDNPGSTPPRRLILMFGGNGSLALEWTYFLTRQPAPDIGALLIDYPSYGACQGRPNPATIQENTLGALRQLATLNGWPPIMAPAAGNPLKGRVCILAHSLGCAAALQFAALAHLPANGSLIERLVLIAPFTSIHDMAVRRVGPAFAWLSAHPFDNRARLRELAASPAPPPIRIWHGTADDIVPWEMGQELAKLYPGPATFTSVPGGGHSDIVETAWPDSARWLYDTP